MSVYRYIVIIYLWADRFLFCFWCFLILVLQNFDYKCYLISQMKTGSKAETRFPMESLYLRPGILRFANIATKCTCKYHRSNSSLSYRLRTKHPFIAHIELSTSTKVVSVSRQTPFSELRKIAKPVDPEKFRNVKSQLIHYTSGNYRRTKYPVLD